MTDIEFARSVLADYEAEHHNMIKTFMGVKLEEFTKEELIIMTSIIFDSVMTARR